MSVAFEPGESLSRGDLDLYLQNSVGNPANAYEISYAIYYVDPVSGAEVLVGPAVRIPQNPTVGEYYAALQVPPNVTAGDYRIRWTFRELAGAPQQQVVQEFAVVDPALGTSGGTAGYTTAELQLIRSLRILLRDNCIGGEETVELDVDGERMVVQMDELWEALKDVEVSR